MNLIRRPALWRRLCGRWIGAPHAGHEPSNHDAYTLHVRDWKVLNYPTLNMYFTHDNVLTGIFDLMVKMTFIVGNEAIIIDKEYWPDARL